MEKVTTITSRTVVLPVENVDTDQIIPARFLKATSKVGLGANLFADWRFDADGQPKADFVLNRPEAQAAPRPTILVAGDNFGCGSSREHAPWALYDYGIRAVVSTSIADIFRNNALKNGIVPVVVAPAVHAKLLADAGGEATISVADQTLTLRDGTKATFPIDPFARYCLLNGVDELEFLLSQGDAIAAFEARRAS
jgi:3-isopropylmalate/(R)-2-methylmalate dehydratase small subunit